jgi:predicted Zn-dependent protease
MKLTHRTRKRLVLLLTLLMVLGIAGAGGQVLRKARLAHALDIALREGSAAYEAGDYPTAMRHLSFYVARRREHDAVLMLADCRRRIPQENHRHITAALDYARFAVDLDPRSLPAHELLLDLYHEAGYATEAASAAEALLAIQPRHRRALEIRIFALARMGRFEPALAAARDLARDFPDDLAAHRLVAQFMELTDRPVAEIRAFLEESAQRAPAAFSFALLNAEAALLTGDFPEAFARATAAAQLPIASGQELAQFLRLLDVLAARQPEARALADSLMNREFPAALARDVAVVAAQRAWKLGRSDLAWQHISEAVERSPSLADLPPAALGWWILLQNNAPPPLHEGTQAEGRRILDHLRASATHSDQGTRDQAATWLAIIEGTAAMDAGNLRVAAQHLEAAAASQQRESASIAEFLLGHLDRRGGDWRRAAARWEILLHQDPNWRALRNTHTMLLLDNGQFDEAVRRAGAALEWTAERTEALLLSRAIMALLESGRADADRTAQLLPALDSIARQAPEEGAIQACAARAHLATGSINQARNAVTRVLQAHANPPPADLVTPLAAALRPHDAEQARQLIERTLHADISPDAIYARAVLLADDGNPQEARALLQQHIDALERGPAGDRARLAYQFRLFELLSHIGDPVALSYLGTLATDHRSNPEIQTALLDTLAAWQDEALITAAIQRLREAAGPEALGWRIYEARRLLTFTPSSARASQAVQILAPIIRPAPDRAGESTAEPSALALAGEAYLLLDGRDLALQFFSRAVDADPGRPGFYPRLIDLLMVAGRGDEAARRLNAFAGIDPIAPEFRRLRAQLALNQGQWELAHLDYAALASAPGARPEDRFGLAIVHLRRDDPALAAPILDELVRDPRATPAMLVAAADLHGSSALRLGTSARRAESLPPADRLADIEAGRQILEAAPADIPPQLRQALIASYLQRHGQADSAEAILAAAAAAPGDAQPDAIAELVRYYLEAGRLDDAQQALAPALSAHAAHPAILRIDALLRIQRGENTPAVWDQMDKSLAAWADAPTALRDLAQAMRQQTASPDDAPAHLARMQKLTADHPTFYFGWQLLVQALLEAGQPRRAADAALAAMRSIPLDARPAHLAATVLLEQQRYDEALAAAMQWRSRAGDDTFHADLFAAWVLRHLARPQEALRLIEPWRQRLVDRGDPERLTLLASLLIDVGRTAEAGRLVWPLVERASGTSELRAQTPFDWSRQYLALTARIQSHTQAREWLSRIQPFLVDDAVGRLTLAEAWYQLLGRTRADSDLQQVILLASDLTSDPALGHAAHLLLAASHETLDRGADAERHYRAALAQRPDDMIILNNLAYLLAHDETTAAEAAELASRALLRAREAAAAGPLLHALLDTLGVAHLAARNWDQAEAAFAEALTLKPDAADLMVGLAEARHGLGRTREAAGLVQRISASRADLSPSRARRLDALERQMASEQR